MPESSKHRVVVCAGGSGGENGRKPGCAWLRPGMAAGIRWKSQMTCNEAEYRAVISGLRASPIGAHALIYSDSRLAVRQHSGEYQTYEPRLRDLLAKMKRAITRRKLRVELRWIPRERNKADRLLRENIGL
jgi:ribonuclease HI